MKVLSWIIPILIVFAIFYFGKPSNEKCREIAIEKLAEINIKASPNNILIDDKVFLKTIRYVSGTDTLKVGHGFFFQVRVRASKLKDIKAHQNVPAQPKLIIIFIDMTTKRAMMSLQDYEGRGFRSADATGDAMKYRSWDLNKKAPS